MDLDEIRNLMLEVLSHQIDNLKTFIKLKKSLDDNLRKFDQRKLEVSLSYLKELSDGGFIDEFDKVAYCKYLDHLISGKNPFIPDVNPDFNLRFNEELKNDILEFELIQHEESIRKTYIRTTSSSGVQNMLEIESPANNETYGCENNTKNNTNRVINELNDRIQVTKAKAVISFSKTFCKKYREIYKQLLEELKINNHKILTSLWVNHTKDLRLKRIAFIFYENFRR